METNPDILKSIEKGILELEKSGKLSFNNIIDILKKREQERKAALLPVSIFKNNALSALETIVKYLKEVQSLDYKQIANLLARNYDPIAITYRNAKKKMPEQLNISSRQSIPLSIFQNKTLSILENLTSFLKEKENMTYHQIAVLLNRNDRTIWTVCNRARQKNAQV